jgi:preprotein translocase SecE subunit
LTCSSITCIIEKSARRGDFSNMNSLTTYISSVKKEMAHVTWPTKQQTVMYTGFVIVISLVAAYMLGAFDAVLKVALERLITLNK